MYIFDKAILNFSSVYIINYKKQLKRKCIMSKNYAKYDINSLKKHFSHHYLLKTIIPSDIYNICVFMIACSIDMLHIFQL